MEHTNWREEFDEDFAKGGEWISPNMKGEYIKSFIEKVESAAANAAFKRGLERAVGGVKCYGMKMKDGRAKVIGYQIGAGDLEVVRALPDEGADKK